MTVQYCYGFANWVFTDITVAGRHRNSYKLWQSHIYFDFLQSRFCRFDVFYFIASPSFSFFLFLDGVISVCGWRRGSLNLQGGDRSCGCPDPPPLSIRGVHRAIQQQAWCSKFFCDASRGRHLQTSRYPAWPYTWHCCWRLDYAI